MTVRVYIERHLADHIYRDQELAAGTHLLHPANVEYRFENKTVAVDALEGIAGELGCDLTGKYKDGVVYYAFDGPEEGECQGYASLYLNGSAATGGYEWEPGS